MKNLFKNILDAPAATFAGALTGAIGVVIASDIGIPKFVIIILLAISAFLSVFSGPNKPK